jgi:hypothetical protein
VSYSYLNIRLSSSIPDHSQRVFEALGFKLDEVAVSTSNDTSTGPALFPPRTLPTTSEGRQNRAKLLRAWVEISAWLVDYLRRQGMHSSVLLLPVGC